MRGNLALELGNAAVLQLRRARVVAAPLRLFDLQAQRLELFLLRPRTLDGGLLLLPLRRQARALLLEVRELALEPLEPLLRRRVGLLAQRLALDLELHDAPLDLVELGRHRVDLHAQA